MVREERGVNGGIKKWEGRFPKREELLRNGFRNGMGLPMTDTGHRECLCNWQFKLQKVIRVRKGEQAREETVKYVNGQILRDGVEVKIKLAEYFEQVLNVAAVREANINVVGNWRMPVLGDLNETAILLEEVWEAVNEMKSGKAPALDGYPVE